MTDPFASFVADPANQEALAAARLVADSPRMRYLLLVQGQRGAGKTYLLKTIRDRAASAEPPRTVEMVAVARLAELVHARGLTDAGAALRDRLLRAELVLLDDLDTAERHLAVQAFLFDVIESRLVAGQATVAATARPLGRMADLDGRLLRRLREATTVELGLPGKAARTTILERRIAESGMVVAPLLGTTLAAAPFRSLKEYLGALNRVLAVQQAAASPIQPADALALLGLEASQAAEPARVVTAAPEAPAEPTEFDAFLTEVTANVTTQFDHWRGRLREVIAHWQERGFRTRRLEAAIASESGWDPDPLIAEFGHDAGELQRLAAEIKAIAPDLAGAEVFRDPDQLAAARQLVTESRLRRAPLSAPLPDLALARLGVGSSNRVALEAIAATVADRDGRHTPLVLVGPSGVGKTHLLHGLGNALVAAGLGPIACLSAHSFLGELTAHKAAEDLAQWRSRYQWVAALLIDDLHLLANERSAQAELLQIFSALADGSRIMAFTSARPLSELDGFDPRLLNRLEGGIVAEVGPPDRDVRLAVIKSLLADTPAADDVGLIDYLAARAADSARAVQGLVHRLLAEAQAERTVPSAAFAREALEAVEPRPARKERRSGAASGILSPGMGVIRSREKMVLVWPKPEDRLIGDFG